MRILHVVENLDKGAVENWLIRCFLASRNNYPLIEWTFYCMESKNGRLDDAVIAAGGRIIYSKSKLSNKLAFLRDLRNELKIGKYDIVHTHHDYISGFYMIAAIGIPFKRRILHLHNVTRSIPTGNLLLKRALIPVFRIMGLLFHDTLVGIAKNTLFDFVGKQVELNKRYQVLYYGVNFERFKVPIDEVFLREQLNVGNDKLLLFAGTLDPKKNPHFLLQVLRLVLDKRSDVTLLLIGEGAELENLVQIAKNLGISKKVRFLGWRNDVHNIMKVADVFLFARDEEVKEGLGLVVVEAQAAGMRMVLSNGIVEDAVILHQMNRFISLAAGHKAWADEVLNILGSNAPLSRNECLLRMEESHFNLIAGTDNLMRLYA